MERAPAKKLVILTIGHSTRPLKVFLQMLKAHQVRRLVDVRTVPRSRHNPQFNRSSGRWRPMRRYIRARSISACWWWGGAVGGARADPARMRVSKRYFSLCR